MKLATYKSDVSVTAPSSDITLYLTYHVISNFTSTEFCLIFLKAGKWRSVWHANFKFDCSMCLTLAGRMRSILGGDWEWLDKPDWLYYRCKSRFLIYLIREHGNKSQKDSNMRIIWEKVTPKSFTYIRISPLRATYYRRNKPIHQTGNIPSTKQAHSFSTVCWCLIYVLNTSNIFKLSRFKSNFLNNHIKSKSWTDTNSLSYRLYMKRFTTKWI